MKKSIKRRFGVVFMIVGAVLMLAALSLLVYNRQEAREAEDAAEEVRARLEEEMEGEWTPALSASGSGTQMPEDGVMPTVTIDGYEYIGTVGIPRFGLELPVMSEWSYPGLRIAPGRYSGSVWLNDLVICGHNYERHFGNLRYLEEGDTITFTDVLGNTFRYEVEEVNTLQPTAVKEMTRGDWDLTLFTCTVGGQTRVTVRCSLVEETDEG